MIWPHTDWNGSHGGERHRGQAAEEEEDLQRARHHRRRAASELAVASKDHSFPLLLERVFMKNQPKEPELADLTLSLSSKVWYLYLTAIGLGTPAVRKSATSLNLSPNWNWLAQSAVCSLNSLP